MIFQFAVFRPSFASGVTLSMALRILCMSFRQWGPLGGLDAANLRLMTGEHWLLQEAVGENRCLAGVQCCLLQR